MRHPLYACFVVLASCATALPITRPSLAPPPVVPSLKAAPKGAPTSPPTAKPTAAPPYPMALQLAAHAAGLSDLAGLVSTGSATWNAALGETVFAPNGRRVEVDVMDRKRGTGGWVVGEADGSPTPRFVHFYPGAMDPPDGRMVVLHELGHLLGCDHSPDYHDVMFPRLGWPTDLTPADVERARAAIRARRVRPAT